MNEYSVDRIEGNTAVLINGGLTVNIPLSSLPENVSEGDILRLNRNGEYELDTERTAKLRAESASRLDDLFQGETYDIRRGINRRTLYNEVCSTLYRSTLSELRHMIPELVLLAVSIAGILTITLVDWQRYAMSIKQHDISSYLGTICAVFLTSVGVIGLILSCVALLRTFRKLKNHVVTYKGNLRRMQDKLANSGVFTKIKPEEEGRFDSVFTQISESLKNRKKNT